jgi:TctA family transporter
MDLLHHLLYGFSIALTLSNLAYCFIGVLLGTIVGVLPGLGPVPTIAMLLPLTFGLPPTSALIMLAGLYYGTQYGGSTTSILINVPGEAASIVTALDGNQMAKQGRAGAALATAAIGSFFAGTIATVLLALFAPPLAEVALQFGPPEYFSLMILGLVAVVLLASGSVIKALAMIVLGVLLGLGGKDLHTGDLRLTFGLTGLNDGVDFVALAMGIFGLSEIVRNLEGGSGASAVVSKVGGLLLSRDDWHRIIAPILRGTALGSVLGVLPGGGALLGSFAAYTLEKRIARDPGAFGKGAIEGVAAPESANNAGAQTSFIPMLTLGIPSNAVMALMLAALVLQGIVPGPNVMVDQPDLFWGLIASMWIGNLMLLALNLPLIGIWIRLLTVPYDVLYPVIVAVGCIGAYSVSNNPFDAYVMAFFGVAGYLLVKLDCEPAPLLLGFVLGPLLEQHFHRTMLLAQGNLAFFLHRPISLALLALAALALAAVLLPSFRAIREKAFTE